jgi:hypothetical protein
MEKKCQDLKLSKYSSKNDSLLIINLQNILLITPWLLLAPLRQGRQRPFQIQQLLVQLHLSSLLGIQKQRSRSKRRMQ